MKTGLYEECGFDEELDKWEILLCMAKDSLKEHIELLAREKMIVKGYKNDIKDFRNCINEEKQRRRRLNMCSNRKGKREMMEWIRQNVPQGAECLDVGACDGIWSDLVGDFLIMDAVEVFQPNIETHHLRERYRYAYCADVREFEFEHYGLIIFGDVIEHMSVEDAQKVLAYAEERADEIIVAVPFMYKQGEIYGNPFEVHVQDDLTPENFNERYPGYEPIFLDEKYAYYHKTRKDKSK